MKKIEIGTKKEVFVKREVGKELLKIEVTHFYFPKNNEIEGKVERIEEFYEEIVNNCKNYAEGALWERIKREFDESVSSGEGRKFKKYLFKVECKAKPEQETLEVEFDAGLSRAGRLLEETKFCHVWDVNRALIVPQYNRKKFDKKESQTT